jgi:hypothetical protein
VDLYQPLHPITPPASHDHVDVSGAKLSQPSLLHRIRRYEDQHLDPMGPCSWGRPEFWLQPGPFKLRGHQPLGEFAQAHFHLLVSVSIIQRRRILMQDLSYACSATRGVTLPEDVARQEANRTNNEWQQE